jgi:rhodanese-related sulfurtransferase
MIQFLKKIFGSAPKADYAALLKSGAVVVDVRTKTEYATGHIKGSINIPLQELSNNLSKIKKTNPVITCCASGMRSSTAASLLKAKGYNDVYNAGSWMTLKNIAG